MEELTRIKLHAAIYSHDDPLYCQCGFPVNEYNIHLKPYELLKAQMNVAKAAIKRAKEGLIRIKGGYGMGQAVEAIITLQAMDVILGEEDRTI